jgi:biotin transport system substrate-specific component
MGEISSSTSDVRKMAYSSLFAALVAVGAYVEIPLPLVPITLQVLFVLLAGAMLGARWGALSMLVYVLLGMIGLPVFSGGSSGLGVLLGTTGGYIIGFIVAAFVVGYLSEKKGTLSIIWNMVHMFAGLFVIFLFGASYLMHVADLTFSGAMAAGILPFIPGGIIKVILASVIASKYTFNK